jgi:cell wall-associated NlpC family hydrolase
MRSKLSISQILDRRLLWWLIGLVVVVAAGCAGTPSRASTRAESFDGKARIHSEPPPAATAKAENDLGPVEQRLRSEVRKWEGTPHRVGGATRRGIDCSGFVQRVYQDIYGRQIPRSTALQVKSGRPISKNKLRTGDLVFFKVPSKGRHVGIYLGQSEFAHASTSKGVTISSLEDHFWRRSYWTARRYLNAPN